ncbi:MAG: SDR family oxidoreductase [Cyclobacteriaceae bacterium]|nr:SDR family oxidoreductase [Cyclobacteriaceae bacterium]
MKVFLTGANGLLGHKLALYLLEKGDIELMATGRGPSRIATEKKFSYKDIDLTHAEVLQDTLIHFQPDVVIHTAAMTQADECELNPEACWAINTLAVENLGIMAGKLNAFFIHLSTDFVFDGFSGPYRENDLPNPVSKYGNSKLASEKAATLCLSGWAIVRTVLVYGVVPNMSRNNLVLWVKDSLEKGIPIKVVSDQWRTPTLVDDLAEACWLIANKRAHGLWHISGEEILSPYQMALKTAEFFGLNSQLIEKVDASTFSQPAKRPQKTGFIIDKARTLLGYKPHSFEEGLKELNRQLIQYKTIPVPGSGETP